MNEGVYITIICGLFLNIVTFVLTWTLSTRGKVKEPDCTVWRNKMEQDFNSRLNSCREYCGQTDLNLKETLEEVRGGFNNAINRLEGTLTRLIDSNEKRSDKTDKLIDVLQVSLSDVSARVKILEEKTK